MILTYTDSNRSPNGNYGYAGIVADNDLITITSASTNDPSLFDQFSNGIVATNSILNISNTRFWHMQPEAAYNGLGEQSVAVKLDGTDQWSSLRLSGLANTSLFTIENCGTGVKVTRAAVTVTDTRMDNLHHGIIANGLLFQSLKVHNNEINARITGIGAYLCDLSGFFDISGNVVNMNDDLASENETAGIVYKGARWPTNWSKFNIKCNEVNLDHCLRGIIMSGYSTIVRGFTGHITNNTVNVTNHSVTRDGILLDDAVYTTVYNNEVTGNDPTNDWAVNAIRIRNSPLSRVQQNLTNNTRVGLQFEGTSNSSDLVLGNELQDHYHGMELQLTGVLGTQNYSGNRWTGYDGSPLYEDAGGGNFVGAWADIGFTQPQLALSQFIVSNQSTIEFFPFFTPLGSQWFVDVPGTNQTFANPVDCENLTTPVDIRLGILDSLIVNDSVLTEIYPDEIKLLSALHLREKLELYKQSDDLNGFFTSFMDTFSLSPSGKICRYRDTLMLMAPLGFDSITGFVSNESILQDYLNMYAEYSNNDSISEFPYLDELAVAQASLNELWVSSKTLLYEKIEEDVLGMLASVSTTHIIETNLKFAYAAFFKYVQQNVMDGETKDSLEAVAFQCIYEGGPGVIISRNILSHYDTSYNFNDATLCEVARLTYSSAPVMNKNEKETYFRIFPNPADEYIIIASNQKIEEELFDISIVDIAGRTLGLFNDINIDRYYKTDTSFLTPGIYTLQIGNDKYWQTYKFIIAK